ncbi:MAG: PD40 domain-containing protein, partial [Janthinobacterium lividum]|nr:PD40 domain-containing protein [Janthinobacterium lividum]
MKKTRILTAIAAASALLLSHSALALPNTQDTRMLSEPAVSSRHIAFIYAGDVWLSNLDGGGARRLTSDLGEKSNPVFSPDGSQIAYSANIDGNIDVYVIAAAGGVPRRLTFHPGADLAQSFTPDGQCVMFTSPRAAFNNRFQKLFTVPVAGGVETQLEIPNASRATYSPDGKRIAYNPLMPAFKQWKRYRGGTNSWLWLFSSSDKSIEKIPQPSTRSNDVDPIWLGDT